MKDLRKYLPLALQVSILIIGYLFINTGLAIDNNNNSYDNLNQELALSTPTTVEEISTSEIAINDDAIKNTESTNTQINETTDKEDEELIEKWMIEANNDNWKIKVNEISTIETQEEEMPLEEWMTDLSYWNK